MPLEPWSHLPLLSGVAWAIVAVVPFLRTRPPTPTERFFAAFSALVAAYGVADWLYLNATAPETALTLLRLRDATTATGVVVLAFLARRTFAAPRAVDALLFLPLVPFLVLLVTTLDVAVAPTSWGYAPARQPNVYPVLPLFHLFYVVLALATIGAKLDLVRHTERAAWHQFRLVGVGVGGITAVGVLLAGYGYATGGEAFPAFSSLLVLPALLLAYGLVAAPDRMAGLVRGPLGAARIRALVLATRRGDLVASHGFEEEGHPDRLPSLLRVLDNVMRIMEPTVGAAGLRGFGAEGTEVGIVRGVHTLLVVIGGEALAEPVVEELRYRLWRFEATALGMEPRVAWDDPSVRDAARRFVETLARETREAVG